MSTQYDDVGHRNDNVGHPTTWHDNVGTTTTWHGMTMKWHDDEVGMMIRWHDNGGPWYVFFLH